MVTNFLFFFGVIATECRRSTFGRKRFAALLAVKHIQHYLAVAHIPNFYESYTLYVYADVVQLSIHTTGAASHGIHFEIYCCMICPSFDLRVTMLLKLEIWSFSNCALVPHQSFSKVRPFTGMQGPLYGIFPHELVALMCP